MVTTEKSDEELSGVVSLEQLLAGLWVRSDQPFEGVSIGKSSSGDYWVDTIAKSALMPLSLVENDSQVLTLVGSLSEQTVLDVIQRLKNQGLDLLAVRTLCLEPGAVEFYFRCFHELDQQWWADWLEFVQALHLDIGTKAAEQQSYRCRLACFDMDSTLIKAEVIDELAAEAGLMAEVSAITEQAMRGELDFQQSFRKRLEMLAGLPEKAVKAVLGRIQLMDGAEALFEFFKQQGIHTAILSGGFDVFARHVQQQLRIHEIHANQLNFEDGVLTGKAVDPIMDAERKQQTLKALAQKLDIPMSQTLAVGDGANDLQMIAEAGVGIAFRAKPKVQASARIAIRYGDLSHIPFFLGFARV